MAQRLIHKLFAERLIEAGGGQEIKDAGRFTFGSLLPDAYREQDASGDVRRDSQILTHYKKATPDMLYRIYDFAHFYRDFKELIMTDDMYLGYYIHIVEDAMYRYFTHTVKHIPRVASPGMVTAMHRDYHLLNAYIMERYPLTDDAEKPEGFEKEAINRLYLFEPDRLLAELKGDYTDDAQGQPARLTGEILDEFVGTYVPVCSRLLRSARLGEAPPDPLEYKWSAGDRKDYL